MNDAHISTSFDWREHRAVIKQHGTCDNYNDSLAYFLLIFLIVILDHEISIENIIIIVKNIPNM